MRNLCIATLVMVAANICQAADEPARPNVLWIVAEDMSPTLGCYGDRYADTPNIDALAMRSLLYRNAFATTPVCSPARACLINGVIATSQGAHPMRSEFPIPEEMLGFPALLREAGYFTSNNVKTDYNSGRADEIIEASWSENGEPAHWRHRKKGQPFFSVFNLMTSHQSRTMVWSYRQFQEQVQSKLAAKRIHDPDKAPLPPYYPDTPLVRKTVARFYDCVSVMDQQVGDLLGQLKEDGLEDSTIVFFYSDHGSGMPRHKRALLDSGMKVPLLVHYPDSLSPSDWGRGEHTDRLVCFEDFAKTVLKLADVRPPAWMRGASFLDGAKRRYVFGHRDRVDEIWDMARSVRSKRYLYIRNYMPHLGYNQQSAWIDQGEIRKDFYAMAASGKMNDAQRHFLSPTRPVEELYDCHADPQNLHNLLIDGRDPDQPKHAGALTHLRRAHQHHLTRSRDLGFIAETELRKIPKSTTPADWARQLPNQFRSAIRAASLVGRGSQEQQTDLLRSQYPSVRYWGAVGLTAQDSLDIDSIDALKKALADRSECVRTEAASALVRHKHGDGALPVLGKLLDNEDTTVILHAARTIELLGERARPLKPVMQSLAERYKDKPGDPAWFIRFTTSGFLSRLK